MPIPFACRHCGLETLVDDEYAGQNGPCANCGKEITVPWLPEETATPTSPSRSAKLSFGYIACLAIGGIGAAAIVISVAVLVFFPAIRTARMVVQERSCESNLKKIWMAMQAYEEEHGTLPPAFIPDENGKPKHSWRVLLLPYLDEKGLYDRYDFDLPWDNPINQQLVFYMPEVYACQADLDASPSIGETSYMLLVGKDTMFPGAEPRSINDIRDDPATTIMVVETPVAGIGWMQPQDLKADRMQFSINGGFGLEIGSYHDRGAHVLMADGTVHFLSDDMPADYIEGMSTFDGSETIPVESLDNY